MFELLGCDILVDEQLQPFLLEINTNPAIFLDTPV
jgi:D-alanine-D-alanine ligase-like ATP-grasp enzyme